MKIATYNIHYGVGKDGKLDLERIVAPVRDADIIALQEVETNWDRSSNTDQPTLLASILPDHEVAWGPTIDTWKVAFDGSPRYGVRRQFGNMLLSRYPIISIRNYLFPKYGATDFLEMQRGALEAVIDGPNGPLRIYSTHLCNLSEQQRLIQVDWLLDHHSRTPDEGPVLSGRHADPSWSAEPTLPEMPRDAVMLGDFNFQPTSECYRRLVGEWTDRYGHLTHRRGFVDAWAVINREAAAAGGGATALKENKRIDYCFVSAGLRSRIASAQVNVEADGSDHQPLIVVLNDE
ncbi:endonuclease/exonuclease/phosphatase family protein [Microbacteriaceae bacterium K1510]|nr:endonuclease/exonuclease/phosphatase family protein [Microbacteriaceae bacterium K1510]